MDPYKILTMTAVLAIGSLIVIGGLRIAEPPQKTATIVWWGSAIAAAAYVARGFGLI